MTIRSAIRNIVIGNAGVLAILKDKDKVYPEFAPTSATNPMVIISKISDVEDKSQAGVSNLSRARIQFSIYSYDSDEAEALEKCIRDLMRNLKGVYDGIFIRCVTMDNDVDASESAEDGSEDSEYKTILDYNVWYDYTV